MSGVELISKTEILESNFSLGFILLMVIATCLLIVVSEATLYNFKNSITIIVPTLIITIICWITIFIAIENTGESTGRYEYEAHITSQEAIEYVEDNYDNVKYESGIWYFQDKE